MKEQLQKCIRNVEQSNSFTLDLEHNSEGPLFAVTYRSYRGQLRDNEEPIAWDENFLDEYWNDLECSAWTDIYNIQIENVEITKEHLASLVETFGSAMEYYSSTYFSFNNANLCGKGIKYLSTLVDMSSKLQCFSISHNRIDNMESTRRLSMSLKRHACIDNLSLDFCDLGSTPEILLVILQSDIKVIDLNNNNIDSLGAVKIAEYLEGDPPIQRIYLGHNRLSDNDAILISQALKTNTNLRHLGLIGNNFTSIGAKTLLTCVFDASSLNAISDSNHTMKAMKIISMEMSDSLDEYIEILVDLDRTQKLCLALNDKDSLLKYLANVPVELIPEVLSFPRWVDDLPPHKHLNIVYSTMRWWNMPMLYSYHDNCAKSDAKRKRVD